MDLSFNVVCFQFFCATFVKFVLYRVAQKGVNFNS